MIENADMCTLKRIADHYGLNAQMNKLHEELRELDRAVSRYFVTKRYNRDVDSQSNLIEEIADVDIMIRQIIYLLRAESESDVVTKYKLERQLARMKSEGEENEEAEN